MEKFSHFPTPDISHLNANDYDHVYEPAEDTFLLMDALEKDIEIITMLNPSVSLEVGCGSGIVSTFLAQILKMKVFHICSDVNPKATAVTLRTARQNNVDLNPVLTDLASALLYRCQGNVDILIFNPPYVVTPPVEVGSSGIEASWAGGERGREVMDRFFPQVPLLLSKCGVFYLVVIKENDIDEIQSIMEENGFIMNVVLSRKSGPEHLSVLRFTRKNPFQHAS
ncbi:hemK methyltransferase family member 2 isoform X2 [Lingula anatina]|uniref:Methyltransferase HEMK2 n=1 Tax=Lingula anatina TaxID=7574 RepID=A0A1S3H2W1_LINAN|nr:hemK methyltransferase family member 2 isoform X2 [Lingula anatina]|eukprot:XP_013379474.1 hemK methyltransferase family member 2 isoform X2 [Lingula anatina]